ncbi:hypothetical protein [Saccharothrix deserti]|uniref:hypothetical protein n=1 Tax=Saccharothrix deserti TaxID=2593674 RepID=UPI00131EC528|nr:hypothetical protein [Saccharothrix deserti]
MTSLRTAFLNTSDRRPTPAKKTPPVLVSNTHESRQESTSMADKALQHQPTTRRWDGAPETPADTRFYDPRETGYRGPIDQDGYAARSDEGAGR